MKIFTKRVIVLIFLIIFCAINFTNGDTFLEQSTLILLGDSILNNAKYVPKNMSVYNYIKSKHSNTLLLALDDSTINDCYEQLDKIPYSLNLDTTYLFISVGGNDLLNSGSINSLFSKYLLFLKSVRTKLDKIHIVAINLYYPVSKSFVSYHDTIDAWNNLLDEHQSIIPYSVLNISKLIVRQNDLTNDIEPSIIGGQKIADAILNYG